MPTCPDCGHDTRFNGGSLCRQCSYNAELERVAGKADEVGSITRESLGEHHHCVVEHLTLSQIEELLDEQGGGCLICGRAPVGYFRPVGRYVVDSADVQFIVDHNHSREVVRGIICQNCNRALGYLGEDPVVMSRAAKYLLGKAGGVLQRLSTLVG